MLDYLRKRSGGVFSIVIIGAIALVFIFWGISGQDSGSVDDIRINGRAVSVRSYAEIQENVLDQLRQQGRSLSPAEELQARRQALAYLVERESLLELASDTGRTASVDQINQSVKSNPAFQVDGRFNLKLYEEQVPRLFNRSLASFEASVADDLVVGEVVEFIRDLSFSPKKAVLDDFHFSEDKLTLDYAFFPSKAHIESLSPSQEDLAAYYEANKERWRQSAEIKIDSVEVEVDDFFDDVEVTQADLEDAFLEAGSSLTSPESAEVSHILFRFQSLAPTDEEKEAKRAEAMMALERTKSEDFGALAEELSQDTASASQEGSLGQIQKGQTLPSFEEVVFGPGKDQIGVVFGPVETMFGFHLIRVDAYDQSHTKTLEEAESELSDQVRRRKARRLAVNRVEDLLEALGARGDGDLKKAAASLGLEAKTSDFFYGPDDAPAFFGSDQALIEAALAVPIGEVGDPVDTPDHLVLYSPIERLESFIPELTDPDTLAKVKSAWIADESAKLSQAQAAAFLEAAREGWEKAEASLPPTVEKGRTEPFARLRFFEAGAHLTEADPDDFLSRYFALSKPGDAVYAPIEVEGDNPGYLVLMVAGVEPADESALSSAQLSERQKTSRATLGESAYEFWATSRQVSARVQLPPAIEAMITGDEF
ncbi:MAG: SurA N-terminal domain-containing protein [Deltaproteobacteria bacterium]|jgi:peptidyl-prolyl cis-trans isomerase D|nr:SurA N-terminal domain-containing protein [Deltaproteobacteria bacterium]